MDRRALWIVVIAIALTAPEVRAGGNSHPSLVPWKVIAVGAEPDPAPLTLYWVPTSREALRRSELLASDELTRFASQCVAMRIVRLDDYETLERLGVDEVPAVLLLDASGVVIDRIADGDPLSVTAVEAIVREELDQRAEAAEALLDEAADKLDGGDEDEAARLYGKVWDQRCVCPRQARAAHRALRKLSK
jgi:hypothetical protein